MFIEAVPESDATGTVAAMYESETRNNGYLPNYVRAFSHRPELYAAWATLNRTVKEHLDLRIYELATLAAAIELRSSYCAIAHGEVLATRFYSSAQVADMTADHATDPLTAADTAVMDFAAKIARDAGAITDEDVERLRSHGFTDADVFDIASAAAARSFFTKLLEAVGTQPDSEYRRLDIDLLDQLTVGRPLEDTASRARVKDRSRQRP